MEPGERIFPEDLDAAERSIASASKKATFCWSAPGAMRGARPRARGTRTAKGLPGLDASCLPWLHERKIAVLGCDGVSDVVPSGYEGVLLPIHVGTLVVKGVHLIDNADFDALARGLCERPARYEFMFTMAPLILERGTASPVNPIAIF